MKTVLLVDDEKHILQDLGKYLRKKDYVVYTASSIEDARKVILSERLDYAIIDLKLDFTSEYVGAQLVNFVKRNQPKAKTIILSAYPLEHVKEELNKELKEEIEPERTLQEIERDYVSKGGEVNYIEAVLAKLKNLEQQHENKKCFVIMPFSATKSCNESEWNEIFAYLIKPAVEESEYNYTCERSEALYGNIIENILDALNRADLVIADLTDRNPNVYYELGVRHALRNNTILIAQTENDIPFDLRPYATQKYDWKTTKGRNEFKERIKAIIRFIEEKPNEATSPVRKYLNL